MRLNLCLVGLAVFLVGVPAMAGETVPVNPDVYLKDCPLRLATMALLLEAREKYQAVVVTTRVDQGELPGVDDGPKRQLFFVGSADKLVGSTPGSFADDPIAVFRDIHGQSTEVRLNASSIVSGGIERQTTLDIFRTLAEQTELMAKDPGSALELSYTGTDGKSVKVVGLVADLGPDAHVLARKEGRQIEHGAPGPANSKPLARFITEEGQEHLIPVYKIDGKSVKVVEVPGKREQVLQNQFVKATLDSVIRTREPIAEKPGQYRLTFNNGEQMVVDAVPKLHVKVDPDEGGVLFTFLGANNKRTFLRVWAGADEAWEAVLGDVNGNAPPIKPQSAVFEAGDVAFLTQSGHTLQLLMGHLTPPDGEIEIELGVVDPDGEVVVSPTSLAPWLFNSFRGIPGIKESFMRNGIVYRKPKTP
jgi:hypothetical protein